MKKSFILFCFIFAFLFSPKIFPLSEEGFAGLDVFTRVLQYIEEGYVEEVDEKELLRGAIRGMLETLDPHTLYMPPKLYKELKADTTGVFGGIGVEITVQEDWVTVVAPLEGTPAEKAGILSGDRIVKIDGVSTKSMDFSETIQKMRGSKGSNIRLTLTRDTLKQPFDITLKREVIRVPSVRIEVVENQFGIVRISSFQERTAVELRKAVKTFSKESKLKGLILDLRNNPGGLLDEAVDVVDIFLKSGTIVTTESRNKEVIDKREAREEGTEPTYPLIILVNGGSASAAEIVAGALQDSGRGVILGTRTFGKGSVQSVIELSDGSALKLTIARYYTPKGRSIQAEGITPDIVVEPSLSKKKDDLFPRIREENLKGHLDSTVKSEEAEEEVVADYQKKIALDYLKSWDKFGQQGK